MEKEIKSNIVRLRVASNKNAKKILEYYDYNVSKYLYDKEFDNLDEVNAYLSYKIEDMLEENAVLYDIYFGNEFVGQIEVINYNSLTPEIKLWIAKKYQHQGFAEDSIMAVKNILEKDGTFNYFIMEIDYRNIAALSLVEKLGGMEIGDNTITSQSGFVLELKTFIVK